MSSLFINRWSQQVVRGGKLAQLKPSEIAVLLYMKEHADLNDGNIRPGNNLIEKNLGMSSSTVFAALRTLRNLGLIERIFEAPRVGPGARGGRAGRANLADIYRLKFPGDDSKNESSRQYGPIDDSKNESSVSREGQEESHDDSIYDEEPKIESLVHTLPSIQAVQATQPASASPSAAATAASVNRRSSARDRAYDLASQSQHEEPVTRSAIPTPAPCNHSYWQGYCGGCGAREPVVEDVEPDDESGDAGQPRWRRSPIDDGRYRSRYRL